MTEARTLFRLLTEGNAEAFRLVVQLYAPLVRSFLAGQVYRMDEVDDLAQEVFLAAYRSRREIAQVQNLGAWLRGIARNKLLAHERASARRADAHERFRERVQQLVAEDLAEIADADRTDTLDRLLGCIERLPDRLRRIVRAGLDGVKAQILADELNVAVGTVYNLNSQAHRLLRKCLASEAP